MGKIHYKWVIFNSKLLNYQKIPRNTAAQIEKRCPVAPVAPAQPPPNESVARPERLPAGSGDGLLPPWLLDSVYLIKKLILSVYKCACMRKCFAGNCSYRMLSIYVYIYIHSCLVVKTIYIYMYCSSLYCYIIIFKSYDKLVSNVYAKTCHSLVLCIYAYV